jgi:hypothetical protein
MATELNFNHIGYNGTEFNVTYSKTGKIEFYKSVQECANKLSIPHWIIATHLRTGTPYCGGNGLNPQTTRALAMIVAKENHAQEAVKEAYALEEATQTYLDEVEDIKNMVVSDPNMNIDKAIEVIVKIYCTEVEKIKQKGKISKETYLAEISDIEQKEKIAEYRKCLLNGLPINKLATFLLHLENGKTVKEALEEE